MPQLKNVGRFLITIPEPTFKPNIYFNYLPMMKNITTIPFFSHTDQTKTNPVKTGHMIRYEFEDWVLNRSGVLIVWDK
jgi:hypothetical protein